MPKFTFDVQDASTRQKRSVEIQTDPHGMTVTVGGMDVVLDFTEGKLNIYAQKQDSEVAEVTDISLTLTE